MFVPRLVKLLEALRLLTVPKGRKKEAFCQFYCRNRRNCCWLRKPSIRYQLREQYFTIKELPVAVKSIGAVKLAEPWDPQKAYFFRPLAPISRI